MQSKQLVGYIGRNGFSASLPPREEQFELASNSFGFGNSAVSTGMLSLGHIPPKQNRQPLDVAHDIPRWSLFLIVGDRLREIDLRSCKVRTLFESSNLVGVSYLSVPEDAQEDDKRRYVHQLMLRLTDRVVQLNPLTGDKTECLLPESMQREEIRFLQDDSGQLVLADMNREQARLIWYAADGRMTQEKEVDLVQSAKKTFSYTAEMVCASLAAPIPLVWAFGPTVLGPLEGMQRNRYPNFRAGVRESLNGAWPGMVIAVLLALASAAIALRLHRKYHRPRPGLWWCFVFLLGPAGLAAYWLEHRRPPLESCPACGLAVPRDRDGCAACGETFGAPQLLGTEVFA
jgi:hypothetical protein